jgi:16S rRNA (guanine966-N2)-methyltransferase
LRIGGGEARGRKLRPARGDIRPTASRLRAAVFSMLGPDGVRGLRVLDLYAGTGAFGMEALSRGAAAAEFVEQDGRRCDDIRSSLQELGLDARGRVHRGNVLTVLGRLEGKFDVIFADPPYSEDPFIALMTGVDRKGLLATGGTVFLEHSSRTELAEDMPGVSLVTRRKYGDSAVSVYRAAETERGP